MVADEFPACPLCGGFLRAPNMAATPFKWLTIAFSGLAVYGTLVFAILRVLHS
jgi:hypothetical protein